MSGKEPKVKCNLDPEVEIPESSSGHIAVETTKIVTRPGKETNDLRKEIHFFANKKHLDTMTERKYFAPFDKHRIVHDPSVKKTTKAK